MALLFLFYLAALAGAFCRRICGGALAGLWTRGVVASRLVWAVPLGALCAAVSGCYVGLPAFVGLAYCGMLIPHAWAQNGDPAGTAGMSAVWLGRVLPLTVPAYLLTSAVWWPALVAAALCGPAYWVGYKIPSTIPDLSTGTEIGEALTGALIFAGITAGAPLL